MITILKSRALTALLLCFTLAAAQPLAAKVRLPYFFGDNMVLQQQTDAAIWGWAQPGSMVKLTTSWNKKSYTQKADANGKWKLKVATPVAGGPYNITISDGTALTLNNVLIGEVWLCSGQSNMDMPMKGFRDQPIQGSNDAVFNSANDKIRLFSMPRSVQLHAQDTAKSSSWKAASPESVANFSAAGYYFGRILQQRLNVPVGLVCITYGGSPAEAFMSGKALEAFPDIPVPVADTPKLTNKNATTLYNGMLHPFIGYAIKGCLWYQGESNADRPDQYETLFPAMVKSWREEFGIGDFPFYFVQIAPFRYTTLPDAEQGKRNSAYLRDAQRKAAHAIPNSGMVVVMDVPDEKNIHPANKEVIGKRFAYMALAKTYGHKGFGYTSPDFDSLLVNGNTATIKFKDAPNGLTSFGKPLQGFEVAGADKKFYPAKAVIKTGTVQVSAAEVATPVAVRYAFRDFTVGDLFSTEGFPVSSFRTDNW
ncbi:sialate O-acetylesterase [Chitinophaga horti]|uniref:Sialate O-acetylesterase n=1 Tax=Chitinophaga horti TaxID=2920382 RepID=A0ABY6J769_9BACT|nr:sialate O-acetylesterase [Chitinophaga horti]UYQ95528.1 sialate O-acetylesterase [Chitinophaga horti]